MSSVEVPQERSSPRASLKTPRAPSSSSKPGSDYPDFDLMPSDIRDGLGTGADFFNIEDRHNWLFTGKATDAAPPMDVPRGKVMGGTSAINGQVFLRAIPDDFDRWVSMGNDQMALRRRPALLPQARNRHGLP